MSFKVSLDDPNIMFSASHFLREPSKCSRLHGHNYYLSVEVTGSLNKNDFVIDFYDLEKALKDLVEPLDHRILIPKNSDIFEVKELKDSIQVVKNKKKYIFPKSDVCFLPLRSTTSELLAKFFHQKLKKEFPNCHIMVKVGETKTSFASFQD